MGKGYRDYVGYSLYRQYLINIRNSLIQSGVEVPVTDVESYEELFQLGLNLDEVLWYYKVLAITNSEYSLKNFFVPLSGYYKERMRSICYSEFLDFLKDYKSISAEDIIRKNLIGGGAYRRVSVEEEYTGLGDRDDPFDENTQGEVIKGVSRDNRDSQDIEEVSHGVFWDEESSENEIEEENNKEEFNPDDYADVEVDEAFLDPNIEYVSEGVDIDSLSFDDITDPKEAESTGDIEYIESGVDIDELSFDEEVPEESQEEIQWDEDNEEDSPYEDEYLESESDEFQWDEDNDEDSSSSENWDTESEDSDEFQWDEDNNEDSDGVQWDEENEEDSSEVQWDEDNEEDSGSEWDEDNEEDSVSEWDEDNDEDSEMSWDEPDEEDSMGYLEEEPQWDEPEDSEDNDWSYEEDEIPQSNKNQGVNTPTQQTKTSDSDKKDEDRDMSDVLQDFTNGLLNSARSSLRSLKNCKK